ncbi:MAG: hypothetical protein FWH01_12790 [Oscillospiraceae bacterium]|nr:hypothetical protein [Oscillospiraceae bacterium]
MSANQSESFNTGIVTAWQMPHPPVVVPEVGRGREAEVGATLAAMRAASEGIVDSGASSIVIISPHVEAAGGGKTVAINGADTLKGDLGRFGAKGASVSFQGDGDLARSICDEANRSGISAALVRGKYRGGPPVGGAIGGVAAFGIGLDHGTVVPLYFVDEAIKKRGAAYPTLVVISVAYLGNADLYEFGACIARAAGKSGKSVALITSGDLSHKLTVDGPYGFDPAGPEFDRYIVDCMARRDVQKLLGTDEITLERAAQCGFFGLVMLYGALNEIKASGEPRILSYEGVLGVGYAIARLL